MATQSFDHPLLDGEAFAKRITVKQGHNLSAYAALGRRNSDGKYVDYDQNGSGGEDELVAILDSADGVNASSEDKPAFAYVFGKFDQNKVSFITGNSTTTAIDDGQKNGIYLIDAID